VFLLGNGVIGMSLNGNRHLYISDGDSLSIEIPYESLLTFTVDEKHSQSGQSSLLTHVKTPQVVTGLQTSCYKSVHKLSTSCVRTACSQLLEQVWNKLLTTCNKLDGIIRLVTRLF
jgi:hypothetical protein